MSAKKVKIEKKYKIIPYRINSDGWTKIYNSSFEYIENPYAFKIYCYLCYKYDIKKGYSSSSLKEIAKNCKIGLTTVKKAIDELKEKKLINILKLKYEESNCLNNCYDMKYVIQIEERKFTEDIDDDDEEEIIVAVEIQDKKSNLNSRRDNGYNTWKKDVLKRDNYTCQLCGKTGEETILNVHHIERYADNEKLRTDINNGITLCCNCHNKIFNKEKEYEEYFKKLIGNPK